MKSTVLFLCFSGLAMGYDENCKTNGETCVVPEDEVVLMQVRTELHKHKHSRATNIDEALASFEEMEGPVALQHLMEGLMSVPVLTSEEAMLAAVDAQPQLQHLLRQYPDFMNTLGVFKDPKAISEVRVAMFALNAHKRQGHQKGPSLAKMFNQAKNRKVADAAGQTHASSTLLAFSQEPTAILAWLEGWGCTTTIGFTDFPDAFMGMGSASIFGPDCGGNPWISNFQVRPEDEGALLVFGNYSSESLKTEYTVAFVGKAGYKELGPLPAGNMYASAFGVDALYYINQIGIYPNQTYQLMSATPEGAQPLLNITSCLYPWGLKSVPGSTTMVWQCGKDWNIQNDTHKVMKYTVGGDAELLVENVNSFSYLTFAGSDLYYSIYEMKGSGSGSGNASGVSSLLSATGEWAYVVYKCDIGKCEPKQVGELPKGAYAFMVTESGDVVTTSYTSWKTTDPSGSKYWTTYNVTVSPLDDTGKTHSLFSITGNQYLQLVPLKPGTEDMDDVKEGPEGPMGPMGPAGPPGPPGPTR